MMHVNDEPTPECFDWPLTDKLHAICQSEQFIQKTTHKQMDHQKWMSTENQARKGFEQYLPLFPSRERALKNCMSNVRPRKTTARKLIVVLP